nr:MAG TPA: hypothetical protein [Caudoviricetes sp.]
MQQKWEKKGLNCPFFFYKINSIIYCHYAVNNIGFFLGGL